MAMLSVVLTVLSPGFFSGKMQLKVSMQKTNTTITYHITQTEGQEKHEGCI